MGTKQLIPCIYLKNSSAVSGFKDDTLISADPDKLAASYFENGADSIIVFDLCFFHFSPLYSNLTAIELA